MNIVLLGYGKMGKAIEEIALKKGHKILLRFTGKEPLEPYQLQEADVAIEFSTPDSAFHNIQTAFAAGVPVVCGTTAWLDKLNEVHALCHQHHTAFLYASNFSIGVNLFFRINQQVAALMARYTDYSLRIEEIHHTQKKDAPSGTAISLAEGILQERSDIERWVSGKSEKSNDLPIFSIREDPAPGTHHVFYESEIDTITLSHTAHNRKGFAAGALLAAEFIAGKQGIYTLQDVLRIP